MNPTTIGVDLAKRVFEVAVANRNGRLIARHRFTRTQFERCLRTQPPLHVVMEACGTARFWARFAGEHGHRVSVLPAQYVRPYVQRNKTDRTDASGQITCQQHCFSPRFSPRCFSPRYLRQSAPVSAADSGLRQLAAIPGLGGRSQFAAAV